METLTNKLKLSVENKASLLKYLLNLQNSSLFDFSINEADVMSTYREMDEAKYRSTYNSDLISDEYVITSNDSKVLYIYH